MLQSDRYESSKYYQENKKVLTCPFCGSEMYFFAPIYYEYSPRSDWFWECRECGLRLRNDSFSENFLTQIRKEYKKNLKKELKETEEKRGILKERLSKWGKFMSEKEKVKLLAEKLEE